MERRQASLEDSLLVTVERAAELLGVGRTFVYRLINSGDLPSV
ncbi:MAG: helix-turn-helix domain-containing protein, partial [Acidimicrobiales bacterium]